MNGKLTLFLMTRKGFEVLKSIGSDFPGVIDFVVIAHDPNVQRDYYDEIKKLCETLGVVCYDRRERFDVRSAFTMAVSWRWLLDLPETRLIIFHDSLLPKYRGFNPLVSYLINREKKIGVTALYAAQEYDRGAIIAQAACEISYPIKISAAIDKISCVCAELAAELAEKIAAGDEIDAAAQDESEATYSLWRDEEDYRIDWRLPAGDIRRFVDAVGFPYKGALSFLESRAVRLNEVEEAEDVRIENRVAGKVIFIRDAKPVVVCGEGLLKIISLTDSETGESLLPLEKFRTRFR